MFALKNTKIFLLTLIYLYFIFPFYIDSVYLVMRAVFFAISVLLPIIYIYKFKHLLNKERIGRFYINRTLLVFIAILLIVLIIVIIHGTEDYSLFTYNIRTAIFIFTFLSLYVISEKLYKNNFDLELYMQYYMRVATIYVIVSVIFTLIPSLRFSWQQIINVAGDNEIVAKVITNTGDDKVFSRFGLAGFSDSTTSYMCSIGIAFGLYRLYSFKYKMEYIFYVITLLIGTLLYGRSGFVISMILILVFIMFSIRKVKIKRIVSISIAFMILLMLVVFLRDFSPAMSDWYNWALEPFINYQETGKFKSDSTDVLFNRMYFMPSIKTLLIGDGYFTDTDTGTFYKQVDAGIMRYTLFGGIFFSVLYYSIFIYLFRGIYRYTKNNGGAFLITLLIIILIMGEIKFSPNSRLLSAIIPLLFFLMKDNLKKKILYYNYNKNEE